MSKVSKITGPWIVQNEGFFTFDTLVVFLKKTIFEPKWTVPLLFFLKYSAAGQQLLSNITNGQQWLKILTHATAFGTLGRINRFLSWGANNNWTSSTKFEPVNEIVVVTGGSSGIGAEIVKMLIGTGLKAIVVLDVQPLVFATEDETVHFFKGDLSSPTDIEHIAADIKASVGAPTVLINNAGVCRGKTILDATPADIQLTFAVNTMAHYFLCQQFLPSMIAANHGHIVTVASVGAFVQAPQMVDYNASKAAAHSFHEGLTLELKFRYGAPKVRTTLVSQSYVRTPLFEGFKNDSKVFMPTLEPETVAREIAQAVFSGYGGQIVLPRLFNIFGSVRGWPHWLQRDLRNKTKSSMIEFKGKQVIPETEKEA